MNFTKMMKEGVSRRSALRGAIGAIVGPVAAETAHKGAFTLGGLVPNPGFHTGIGNPEVPFGRDDYTMSRHVVESMLNLRQRRRFVMERGTYDADIASLKSVSPAMKCTMQMIRDEEDLVRIEALKHPLMKLSPAMENVFNFDFQDKKWRGRTSDRPIG